MADHFSYVPGSPFLTTSVSDVFSRLNEFPLASPGWTNASTATISQALKLADNQVWGSNPFNFGGAIRSERFLPDQYVRFKVGTGNYWDGGAALRSDPSGPLGNTVIFEWWDTGISGHAEIETLPGWSTVFNVPSIAPPVPGDEVLFSVVGSLYNAFVNGVLVASATDVSRAGGNPGIFVAGSQSILEFSAGGAEYDSSRVSVGDAVSFVHSAWSPEHMRRIVGESDLFAVDHFRRADENPLSNGGKWAKVWSAYSDVELVNSAARGTTGSDVAFWTATSFPDAQQIRYVVRSGDGNFYAFAVIRTNPSTAAETGYLFEWTGGGGSPAATAYVLPSFSALFSASSVGIPADGDVVRFEAEGGTIRAKINDGLVGSAVDSTFPSGVPGFGFFATDCYIEDVQAGGLPQPVSVYDHVIASASAPAFVRKIVEGVGVSDHSRSESVVGLSHERILSDRVGVSDPRMTVHHPTRWFYCAAGPEVWKMDWSFPNSPVMVTSVSQYNPTEPGGGISWLVNGRGKDGWGDPQKDFMFAVDQRQYNLLKIRKDNFQVVAVGTPPVECIYGFGSWTQVGNRGVCAEFDGEHLVVTDGGNSQVLMFQADHLVHVGGIPAGMWGMEIPCGIAYNPNNDMFYVCDFGISSPAGGKIMFFEKALIDPLTGENNPAFFSWKGNYQNVGTGDGQLYNPFLIWFDKNIGNIFIIDHGGPSWSNRIQKFSYPGFEFMESRWIGSASYLAWGPRPTCFDDEYMYQFKWDAGPSYGDYVERTLIGDIDWSDGYPDPDTDYGRPSVKPTGACFLDDTGRPLRYCNELPIPMVAGSGPPGLFYERGSPAYLFDFLTTTPFYLTDNERPIVRAGISYTPAPVKMGRNRKSQASPAEDLTLSLQNVDRRAAKALVDPGLIAARVNVYKCYWTSPISHTPPALVYEGIVNANRAEDSEKTASVAVELKSDFWNWDLHVPKNQFAGNCQWIFKSSTPGCQYVFHYDTNPSSTIVASLCDRTWENCVALKNEKRFRGFRNIEPLERTIWWGRSRAW